MEERNSTGPRGRSRHLQIWRRTVPLRESNEWKELGQRAAALKIASAKGISDWFFDAHFRADIRETWSTRWRAESYAADSRLVRQLITLQRRVAHLENLLGLTGEPLNEDEYIAWCDANRTLLSAYPNSFVAIDLKKGSIVAS